MPRASSTVGECANLSAPQSGTEAAATSPGVRTLSTVPGLGLSTYGMPNHTCGYVLKSRHPLTCPDQVLSTHPRTILDIKADNIMLGIDDDSVFDDFEQGELQNPCTRKEVDGRTIYVSRKLRMPKEWGAPVLCDFGSAMPGDVEHLEDIQPDIYRAPEVILEAPWTYSVDTWNVGCMVRR